jgi:hypothetical protein
MTYSISNLDKTNCYKTEFKAQDSVQKLSRLKSYADVLNIEGGLIPTHHFSKDKKQIWANLAVILDRPLLNGVDLNELSAKNIYPLKESSIPDYNEAKVCLAHLMLLKYYIGQAHVVAKKPDSEKVKIVIQVHRGSSAKFQIKNLETALETCFEGEFKQEKSPSVLDNIHSFYKGIHKNIEVEFRWRYTPDAISHYEDADIVLSLSLVAGLSEELPSGSLTIPHKFVPMFLNNMVMKKSEEYEAPNHLTGKISEVLQNQTEEYVAIINKIFKSPNPDKASLNATALKVIDFKPVTVLQVEGLFNPKSLPKMFSIQ